MGRVNPIEDSLWRHPLDGETALGHFAVILAVLDVPGKRKEEKEKGGSS